jgi:hypothetical protein
MNTVFHILVSDHLGTILNSREAATSLLDIIRANKCSVTEVDFTSVEFMSRSFADQFHKEKIILQRDCNSVIEVVNADEVIVNILRTVSRTQSKSDREFSTVQIFSFSNSNLLQEHLLSI